MQDRPGTIARPRELLLVAAGRRRTRDRDDVAARHRTRHGSGARAGTDADGQFSIWNIAWVARTIVVDPLHLFDANIFSPHKTTLAYSEANLLPGALGAAGVLADEQPLAHAERRLCSSRSPRPSSARTCCFVYLTGDRARGRGRGASSTRSART